MTDELWRLIVIFGAALGQTLFIMVYAFTPWWRGHVGRAVFLANFTLCILIDTIAIRVFVNNHGTDVFALVAYSAVAVAIWYQLGVLIRTRLKAKKNEVSSIS